MPGTFVHGINDTQRSELEQKLRPQDPKNTDLGESEELSLLTLQDDGNAFSVRLEVEAGGHTEAETEAVRLVTTALRDSGFTEQDAPLGPAAVTGIDREF